MTNKCPSCRTENPSDSKFCSECGTPLPSTKGIHPRITETLQTPVRDLSTGSTFAGRYQIIEELGKGGMGKVYKVFDTKVKEKVALKLIKPEIAADRQTIERFSNELKLARKIRHANVCQMFDLGEAEGAHFITMEYVSGDDLKSMLRMMGQLSPGQAISIAKQVCSGLEEAHRLGVIHRDLKPQNIMIDREGNVRIMDFGIARSLRERGITGPSVMVGTPEYMSPEQAEAKEIDQRSDIYSLGIILYEMVTGRVPFEGETALSIAMKHKAETPKDPKSLNQNIPDDLSRLVLKCLEKDKAKRYQSALDLRGELERIEKGLPTTERVVPERKPLTSREITVKFNLRKLFVPALAAMLIIAAGIVFWKVLPKKRAAPPTSGKPSLAILYFENISADPSLDDWKTGLTELLITDLSQSRYINVLSSDRIYDVLKKLELESAKKYSSEDLRRVAEEGNVTYTGSGTIMKAGENIIITFALRNPKTEESIPPHKLECRGEAEITSKIDELTRFIKDDLNLTSAQISTDIDKVLGKITTSSPEAYRFYSEGRKVAAKGDWAQSLEFMKKAIALDPEFAMAYRSMAAAYGRMGNSVEAEKYRQKALEFTDRISDRERLLIQAIAEKNLERRIEIYNKILQLYPDEFSAHNNLGMAYFSLEEWNKAIEYLDWCVKNYKENVLWVGNLARAYEKKGMYDKAKEVLEEYLKTFPDNAYIRRFLAAAHLCSAELDRALTEAERAFSLNPTDPSNIALKGDIFLCREDLKKAEEEYQKLLKPEDLISSIDGRYKLGSLDFLQGKFKQGISELKQALEIAQKIGNKNYQFGMHSSLSYSHLSFGHLKEALEEADKQMKIAESFDPSWHPKLSPLLLKGLCYVQMDSLEEASKIAEEIKALNLRRAEMRWYLLLIGLIELEKKNNAKAIEYLKEALSLEPHQGDVVGDNDNAFFIEPLARAYFESADLENARKEYEEITRLTTGRLDYGDIYARSFYMLGKTYERQGKKAEAIANYQRFLELWKDADPGLPEVDGARQRLTALR